MHTPLEIIVGIVTAGTAVLSAIGSWIWSIDKKRSDAIQNLNTKVEEMKHEIIRHDDSIGQLKENHTRLATMIEREMSEIKCSISDVQKLILEYFRTRS